MAVFAVRPSKVPLILGVGYHLEVIGIPAGIDAATVVQLLALWDRAAEELPAKAMGVAVLCFGDAAVGRGGPREPPAGSQLRMSWLEDGAVDEAFKFGPTGPGPAPALARLDHVVPSVGVRLCRSLHRGQDIQVATDDRAETVENLAHGVLEVCGQASVATFHR